MPPTPAHPASGCPLEVLLAFLRLGLTSFGGPLAHIGYFRAEFVDRRRWLDDADYADLVALCQFLPGPASSQVGMALGLGRAGWPGALAAWLGFTLPSALALMLFAFGLAQWSSVAGAGAVHGLKLLAVAVVAQAVHGMAKSLCPDARRGGIAIAATLLVLSLPTAFGQIVAILLGGLAGRLLLALPPPAARPTHPGPLGKTNGALLLALFVLLLLGLPVLAAVSGSPLLAAGAAFYQAGSLVFGGGHVVLPLLQASVVPAGWVDNDLFLAGYGAAQAVPGPLFSFAAFLGAVMAPPLGGIGGGLLLLVAIFLPALLLVAGTLPFWATLRRRPGMPRIMGGINAAVVGVLAAAFYDPVWRSAVQTHTDFAVALAAYGLLVCVRLPAVAVAGLAALAGLLLGP